MRTRWGRRSWHKVGRKARRAFEVVFTWNNGGRVVVTLIWYTVAVFLAGTVVGSAVWSRGEVFEAVRNAVRALGGGAG